MIATCLAGLVLLAPQEPFPDLPDPQGVVRDEAGRPLAGASLAIEIAEWAPLEWRRSMLHVLMTQPLPPLTSGRDGSFVLPLTRDQRRLGAHLEGALAFVVRLEGYQDWIEELPLGVYGWLGSAVTLHRPGPDEWLEVRMQQPVPGMLAWLETGGLPTRRVPLDAEGRARLPVHALPSPAALSRTFQGASQGSSLRVVYPGRSSAAVAVEGGGEPRLLSRKPSVPAHRVRVRLAGGGEPQELRGLYRVRGQCLWFPLAGNEAIGTGKCELIAVAARGHLAAEARLSEEIELQPLPAAVELQVVDPGGQPVPRAAVFFYPLEDWYGARELSHRLPAYRGRTGSDGRFALPDRLLEQPGGLVVAAPGFAEQRIAEPRAGGGRLVLQPVPCGSLRLRLRSASGKPLPGATVFCSDSAYGAGLAAAPVPHTGADGLLVLDDLPEGEHRLVAVIEGHAFAPEEFSIRAGETTELELELPRAEELKVVTVDGEERPVPFVALVRDWQNEVGPRRRYTSDSRGRLWIRDIPADRTLSLRQNRRGGFQSEAWRIEAGEVHRLEVQPGRLLCLQMPEGSRVFRTIWHYGGGGSTSNGDPGDVPPASRYYLFWAESGDTELRLGIADGPPVRVRGDQVPLQDDDGRPIARPLVLDRRQAVRRVPLQLEVPEGIDPGRLRIEPVSPHYGGKMYSDQNGNMAARDGQGRFWVQARDRGPYRLVALLPGCAPQELALEAAPEDGEERPIRLQLERAGSLSLRLTMPARPSRTADFSIRIDGEDGNILYYLQDTSRVLQELTPGQPFEVPLPLGLPPGKYRLQIDLPAAGDAPARQVEREVEVGSDSAAVVDCDGDG